MNWNPENNRIFETVTGSRLYGTANQGSDFDYRGVVIPPLHVLLDPFHGFDQKDSGFKEEDRCLYAMGKFFKLCADNNPNIVELLFAKNPIYTTVTWERIAGSASLFISKKCKFTFTGYAYSQLKTIERHRKWFINPPAHKPTRQEFGLTDSPTITGEKIPLLASIGSDFINPAWNDELRREIAYRDAKTSWDNYQEWFKTRNPERRVLEEKYGLDCKFAHHVFRLLEEGRQLLLTGRIEFPLHNAEELLRIKNGAYSYEQVMEMANDLESKFDQWYQESKLPHTADYKDIEYLYFDCVEMRYPGLGKEKLFLPVGNQMVEVIQKLVPSLDRGTLRDKCYNSMSAWKDAIAQAGYNQGID